MVCLGAVAAVVGGVVHSVRHVVGHDVETVKVGYGVEVGRVGRTVIKPDAVRIHYADCVVLHLACPFTTEMDVMRSVCRKVTYGQIVFMPIVYLAVADVPDEWRGDVRVDRYGGNAVCVMLPAPAGNTEDIYPLSAKRAGYRGRYVALRRALQFRLDLATERDFHRLAFDHGV